MILLGFLLLIVATVPLAGGRLSRLADLRFARAWAVVVALAIQYAALRLLSPADAGLLGGLHLLSYGLLFYFLAANLSVPGLLILAVGGALNAMAIAANDGVMPARPEALEAAGILPASGQFANSGAVTGPKLWFLGDVFALPQGVPLANVFSIGDLLIVLGAFVALHQLSGSRLGRALAAGGRRVHDALARAEVVRDNRAFRRLFFAQAISSVGDWVFTPAVFAAMVHGDAEASELALLLIFQVGPGMLVGLVGGPFIDRFSRKWLMVGTDVLRALAVGSLLVSGDPALPHVYAVSLTLGIGSALFQPAFLAVMPNTVPARSLTSANALVGFTQSLAVMIGFPLGGLMVDQFGTDWGFSANALTFAFSAALVAGTVIPATTRLERTGSLITELADGFRHVRRNRTVRSVILVVGLITFAAGVKSPLESLFALSSLDAGTTGLGILGAAWGFGMIVGSVVASRVDRRVGHGRMLTGSLLMVGLAVVLASMSPVLAPVALLWVFGGIGNSTGTVAYEVLLQEGTEDAVRGRVMAALEAAIQAGLLAGVGLAALTDMLFDGGDTARMGLLLSGLLFGLAGLASWTLVQRGAEAPARLQWRVEELELVPAGPGYALLRVVAEGPSEADAPALLIDDGFQVHRVPPLAAPGARAGGPKDLRYGVPRSLLARGRSAMALDTGPRPLALPRPATR